MPFTYKPLWKKLIDLDMSKKEFMQKTHISKSTIDKMGRGELISLNIIDKICNQFNFSIDDVIEHVSPKKEDNSGG